MQKCEVSQQDCINQHTSTWWVAKYSLTLKKRIIDSVPIAKICYLKTRGQLPEGVQRKVCLLIQWMELNYNVQYRMTRCVPLQTWFRESVPNITTSNVPRSIGYTEVHLAVCVKNEWLCNIFTKGERFRFEKKVK